MEVKQSQTKNIGQEEWITVALICIKSSFGVGGNKRQVWLSMTQGDALGSHPDNCLLHPAASAGRKWGVGPPQRLHIELHSENGKDYLQEKTD